MWQQMSVSEQQQITRESRAWLAVAGVQLWPDRLESSLFGSRSAIVPVTPTPLHSQPRATAGGARRVKRGERNSSGSAAGGACQAPHLAFRVERRDSTPWPSHASVHQSRSDEQSSGASDGMRREQLWGEQRRVREWERRAARLRVLEQSAARRANKAG